MDYELMMNGTVKLGDKAPQFSAISTNGKIDLKNYLKNWLIFFSYPANFTPVSTTEIIAFEKANTYFEKLNTKIMGISMEGINSHLSWLYDIYLKTGIKISYPIIADRSGEIVRKYGMISTNMNNSEITRKLLIIDDRGIIRLIINYPIEIGRNISEILRTINAFQLYEKYKKKVPANWKYEEAIVGNTPQNFDNLLKNVKEEKIEENGLSWYLSFENINQKKEIDTNKMENSSNKVIKWKNF